MFEPTDFSEDFSIYENLTLRDEKFFVHGMLIFGLVDNLWTKSKSKSDYIFEIQIYSPI